MQIRNSAAKLAFELIVTNLNLLATASPEMDPKTLTSQWGSARATTLSAFKACGFSDGYAEEITDAAFVQFRLEQQRVARKRRLVMLEKRVRQVANTVKYMVEESTTKTAAETRTNQDGPTDWERAKMLARQEKERAFKPRGAQQQTEDTDDDDDIDDETLLGELEALARDARNYVLKKPRQVDHGRLEKPELKGRVDAPGAETAPVAAPDPDPAFAPTLNGNNVGQEVAVAVEVKAEVNVGNDSCGQKSVHD